MAALISLLVRMLLGAPFIAAGGVGVVGVAVVGLFAVAREFGGIERRFEY